MREDRREGKREVGRGEAVGRIRLLNKQKVIIKRRKLYLLKRGTCEVATRRERAEKICISAKNQSMSEYLK